MLRPSRYGRLLGLRNRVWRLHGRIDTHAVAPGKPLHLVEFIDQAYAMHVSHIYS